MPSSFPPTAGSPEILSRGGGGEGRKGILTLKNTGHCWNNTRAIRSREEGGKVERRLRRRNQRGKWLMREGRGKTIRGMTNTSVGGSGTMREEGEEALEFGLEEGEEDPSNRTKPPSPRPLRGGQYKKRRRVAPIILSTSQRRRIFFSGVKLEARGEIDYISSSPFPPTVRRRRLGLE